MSLVDARRLVTEFVTRYNEVRLHSAIDCDTSADKLAGHDRANLDERDHKRDAAGERRSASARESTPP